MIQSRSIFVLFLLLTFGATCASHNKEPGHFKNADLTRHEFSRSAMGRSWRVVVFCPDVLARRRAEAAIDARLAELGLIFDEQLPDSAVSQLARSSPQAPVQIPDDLFALLRDARKLSQASDGTFDFTVGPFNALWQESTAAGRLPTPEELEATRAHAGWERLNLDAINRTAHLTTAGMKVDFSDMLPGFICDRLLAALARADLPVAMVVAGRTVAAGAAPPGTPGWRIEIASAAPKSGQRFVTIEHRGISSSGAMVDFIEIDSVRYASRVNPLTGIGSRNVAVAVVISRRGWQAQSRAAAAALMGQTDGAAWLRKNFPTNRVTHFYPTGG